ncbi:MAG: rod shape-determining protein MreD [Nitriliruptoraceae bacterium]
MILRGLLISLLLVTAVVLETALFPSVTLLGFRPDLLLLLVLAIAVHDGPMSGARVGAVAGLLADLLIMQSPVGLSVAIYATLGWLIGVLRPYVAPDSISGPVVLAFVSGVLGTAAYGTITWLLADQRATFDLVFQAALAVGLYNTLLAPLAYALVGRLGARFPMRGQPAE